MAKINQSEAEILLAHTCRTTRENIFAHPEKIVPLLQKWYFSYLVNKRKNGFPIAYLTGEKEFFGLNFLVNKYTLIPRPETEIMIEEIIKEFFSKKIQVFDIGTGSGCIAITLATKFPNAPIFASDISHRALRTAEINAKNNNVKIEFKHGGLLTPWVKNIQENNDQEVAITANLPYLTNTQFVQEKSIQHEPKSALVSDNRDGLELYRELCAQLKNTNFTRPLTLFFEIDPDQTMGIQKLLEEVFPNIQINITKDLCGFDRIVRARID